MYHFYTKKMGWPPGGLYKMLLVMKITVFILMTVILQVSASSYAQKVTLTETNAQLETIFNKIRQQTGYDFMFSGSAMKDTKKVTIAVKNAELISVVYFNKSDPSISEQSGRQLDCRVQ